MDYLPLDVISPILSCLEVDDICRCSCVSKEWASASRYDPINSKVIAQKPLAIAKRIGDEKIKALLAQGVNAISDERNWESYSPLHFAAMYGSLELVNALLDYGVFVNGKTRRGELPLHLAATKGHQPIVKRLILQGCDIDAKDCNMKTPLILAAHHGHIDVVNELIFHGAQLNARDICDNTALILAAWNGRSSIVEALISSGANVNTKGQNGKTAIQRSIGLHHHQVTGILKRAEVSHDTEVHQHDYLVKNTKTSITDALLWFLGFST